jgi:2-oxoglutarate dehydrogenase E2 component (dihydrolipoamide succinyltransferase)
LETEKITFELPSPTSGTISQLLKQQGESARVGETIGYIEEGEAPAGGGAEQAEKPGEAEAAPERPAEEAQRSTQAPAGGGEQATSREGEWVVMPVAQRALEEHGLRAEEVEPTGPGGRLLKEDVERHAAERRERREREQAPPRQPQREAEPARGAPEAEREAPAQRETKVAAERVAPPTSDREEEAVPMSPMRRTIARRLVEAQTHAALLTTFNEVDMSAVMDLRKQHKDTFEKRYGVRLGFMSFFVKAAVDALKQFPAINAEIREDQIVYRNYYDIGIAVSTERGLAVPILRNAERMSFAEIEKAVGGFGQRAQAGKLELHEMEGGTFTITNGGIFGSMLSTPIVNPPQSGVLGMHAIQERPVARDGEVVIRPMMYLALTYDHRIVDGREAVTFLRRIKEAIEDPARMLLEV